MNSFQNPRRTDYNFCHVTWMSQTKDYKPISQMAGLGPKPFMHRCQMFSAWCDIQALTNYFFQLCWAKSAEPKSRSKTNYKSPRFTITISMRVTPFSHGQVLSLEGGAKWLEKPCPVKLNFLHVSFEIWNSPVVLFKRSMAHIYKTCSAST